jgi:hypothetical protein
MRTAHSLLRLVSIPRDLAQDALQFLLLETRSSAALNAENIFLRKQLVLYLEREAKPRRATGATRLSMVLLSRIFAWQHALINAALRGTTASGGLRRPLHPPGGHTKAVAPHSLLWIPRQSPSQGEVGAECRQLLGIAARSDTSSIPVTPGDYRDRYERLTGHSLRECPICHRGRMILTQAPPSVRPSPPIKDTS